MQTERLLGSTSFRLSAAYAALLVIAFLTAAGIAWIATRSAAESDMRDRINLEMSSITDEISAEGAEGGERFIRSRMERPGSLEYRLVDPGGALVIGRLTARNLPIGWVTIRQRVASNGGQAGARQGGQSDEFLMLTQRLPDGSLLTIGEDIESALGMRNIVLTTLLWVAIPTLIVVFGAGIVLATGTARRLRLLATAMERFGDGDLAPRAPEAGGDEIARVGQSFNEMAARIEQLVASVRRVSRDIAHDLRTPLAHVLQDLEAAAASKNPTVIQDRIHAAQGKIEDILRVFQAMLGLAEIDAGSARARFGPVDLAVLIERIADAYRPDIESAGRALTVDPLERAEVLGDMDLISQALANLVENAMNHTPRGSPIRIGLRRTVGSVGFVVEDRGPGIPQADRERVLEPFVRLDSSRSTPGAGLGLSIVSAIARLHGARLSLEDAQPGLRVALEWPA